MPHRVKTIGVCLVETDPIEVPQWTTLLTRIRVPLYHPVSKANALQSHCHLPRTPQITRLFAWSCPHENPCSLGFDQLMLVVILYFHLLTAYMPL